MPLREAIETYHELLTDELASATQAQLDDQQFRRGLFFGQRPLCTVLRPRFITPEQYRFLQSRVQTLLHAFDKAYYAAIADADFRAQFGLLDWEEVLVSMLLASVPPAQPRASIRFSSPGAAACA